MAHRLLAKEPLNDPIYMTMLDYAWWTKVAVGAFLLAAALWLIHRRFAPRAFLTLALAGALFIGLTDWAFITFLWGWRPDPLADFFFAPIVAISICHDPCGRGRRDAMGSPTRAANRPPKVATRC